MLRTSGKFIFGGFTFGISLPVDSLLVGTLPVGTTSDRYSVRHLKALLIDIGRRIKL